MYFGTIQYKQRIKVQDLIKLLIDFSLLIASLEEQLDQYETVVLFHKSRRMAYGAYGTSNSDLKDLLTKGVTSLRWQLLPSCPLPLGSSREEPTLIG